MPAAKREAILRPDDLRADIKSDGGQGVLDRAGVTAGMPDIRHRAGKGLTAAAGVALTTTLRRTPALPSRHQQADNYPEIDLLLGLVKMNMYA